MKVILTENQLKTIISEGKKDNEVVKFDKTSYYLDYYKNLTPSDFDICKKGSDITITIPK